MHTRAGIFLFPLLLAGLASGAEESLVPPADGKPILQLDAGGPMAAVTAMAFAPDGKTLYAGGFDKVVRCGVFLKSMNDFAAMNEVYGRYFPSTPPARSTVEVSRLPKDVLVEIDVIAIA